MTFLNVNQRSTDYSDRMSPMIYIIKILLTYLISLYFYLLLDFLFTGLKVQDFGVSPTTVEFSRGCNGTGPSESKSKPFVCNPGMLHGLPKGFPTILVVCRLSYVSSWSIVFKWRNRPDQVIIIKVDNRIPEKGELKVYRGLPFCLFPLLIEE